ncbi:PepSY-like domain-containing protein [Gillisia sp. JM1]|uniref:PepSY-like domain-containing protein n=1 Tax=Gillisia sp. JM1 TaxID=1283286 RepID=UPI000413F2AB|nr:PepSY-like domain-containing protein [Gillisia sp. JM1]
MKNTKILYVAILSVLSLQSCSNDEDVQNEADLTAIAFKADVHIRTSSLSQTILNYVTTNYPNLTIVEAEEEDNQNIEITLSDGNELIFDSAGNFLGEDNDEDDDFGDHDVNISDLPQNIKDFITTNYPGISIEEAEIENNGNFEIELENDIELIFDADGNFLGVAHDENDHDKDETDINPSDLPDSIKNYLNEYYPDNTIIEAEIEEDGSYEVTLNNGLELEFDADGNFVSSEDGNGEEDGEDD